MSNYERLPGNVPEIPTLDQLRTGEGPANTASMPEKQQPQAVESASYVVTASNVARADTVTTAPDACMVKGCCCFSLATGVHLIAVLDMVSWMFALIGAGLAIFIKTQEKKIDRSIEKEFAAEEEYEAEEGEGGAETGENDDLTAEQVVRNFNRMADLAFYSAPFVILCALIGLFFVSKGFKAAKGDVDAARVYYTWTRFQAIWRFVMLIFDVGSGFLSFLLSVYYTMVTRSHWLELAAATQQEANNIQVLPANSVTIVTHRHADVVDGAQV